MSQKEIEMILARQLASCLALPIFLVDPGGALVFYNEPAEAILGRRFEETGEMPASEWSSFFSPTDSAGAPVQPGAMPLTIALEEGRPSHHRFWIRGLDNVSRHIEVTAIPLLGQAQRHLGAM